MKRVVEIAIACGMLGGCATAYVACLRSEYSSKGEIIGVFQGEKEYPCTYPATRIALMVELPAWWSVSKTETGRSYEAWLWPVGATFSLVDLALSAATDTVMFPYDFYTSRNWRRDMNNESLEKENRAKDYIVEALEDKSIGMPDAPVLPLVGSENVPISEEEEKDVE